MFLILGTGAYVYFSRESEPTETTDQTQIATPTPTVEMSDTSFSGTFYELMALGENYTCAYDLTDESGNISSGVVYVSDSGDKMNGEFTYIAVGGKETQSNIIRDGQTNYIWSSNWEQGFKTEVTPTDTTLFDTGSETSVETGFDENEAIDFTCERWTVDESMFTPPAEIEFLDISATAAALQEQVDTSIDCSVCEQLPAGDSRDQCLQGLSC